MVTSCETCEERRAVYEIYECMHASSYITRHVSVFPVSGQKILQIQYFRNTTFWAEWPSMHALASTVRRAGRTIGIHTSHYGIEICNAPRVTYR